MTQCTQRARSHYSLVTNLGPSLWMKRHIMSLNVKLPGVSFQCPFRLQYDIVNPLQTRSNTLKLEGKSESNSFFGSLPINTSTLSSEKCSGLHDTHCLVINDCESLSTALQVPQGISPMSRPFYHNDFAYSVMAWPRQIHKTKFQTQNP